MLGVFARIGNWAGGLLSPASPQSSAAPSIIDVRATNRKYTFDVLNGPVASGGSFISPWYDTNISGAQYVSASATSLTFGNTTTMVIQQTDIAEDPALAWNGSYSIASATGVTYVGGNVVNGATPFSVRGPVTARYYRIVFQNGAAVNTYVHIACTESSSAPSFVAGQGGSILSGIQLGTDPTNVNNSSGVMGPAIIHANGQFYQGGAVGYTNYISTDGTALDISIQRTPFLRHGAQFSANTATLWQPQTVGKKVRLMKYKLEAGEDCTIASGPLPVNVQISPTISAQGQTLPYASMFPYTHRFVVPSAVLATSGNLYDSGLIDLGNGVLNGNASTPLIAGIQVPQAIGATTPTFTAPISGQWEACTLGFKTLGNLGNFRLVQSTQFTNVGAATYGLTTVATAPGNLVVIVIKTINSVTGVPAFSVSANTATDTYTATAVTTNTSDTGTTNGSSICMLYTLNSKGSNANAITVATTNSPTQCEIYYLEYAGVANPGSIDAALVGATGNSTSPSSGAYTTTTAGDLIITAFACGQNQAAFPTIPAGYTIRGLSFSASQGTLCVADNFGNGALSAGQINFIGMGTEE